ncbi:MAG: dipeptide epimerase [Chloroflexi bacterium]|jgi:L-alanine-DL-glutamate epimerase-like enolase superfamily enzyme|nr:dipeptide epimerase [Chloroflexota bacterium]
MSAGWDLRSRVLRIPYRDPFRIARDSHGAGASMSTMIVELRSDRLPGLVGLGEGYPDAYYGETLATMPVVMDHLLASIDPASLDTSGPGAAAASLTAISEAFDGAIRGHGAAKCALDTALHDLAGKATSMPVHRLLGLPSEIPPTDFTLGLDEPSVVAERARRAGRFPALKIKVGGPADLATLEAVRAVYAGPLRVDANTGWTPEMAAALLPSLVSLGVELIEQPFPPRRYEWLLDLQAASSLPIVADESAVTIEDLDALVGIVAGVNVKLAKCGGVGAAARMLARARELGFRTFLGCMEETSVGIAASAAVASLAEWVDLDGCLLLADDPFTGLELGDDCRWRLGDAPGLGVAARA